jgi:hypothetical protein
VATRIVPGQTKWSGKVDAEGHHTYNISFRVASDTKEDGPVIILQTVGLPRAGDEWDFDNDFNPWAFCTPEVDVKQDVDGEPYWTLGYTFTTKPPPQSQSRCNDNPVEDPLLEPIKKSGNFVEFTEEATKDRHGERITNSAHEQIRGPQNEWDDSRQAVEIEQNVADLQLPLLTTMNNGLNKYELWGHAPRTIKLKVTGWEEKFFGRCYTYFTRKFRFELKEDGWDRHLLDEGTKVLNGHWDEDTGAWVLDQINGANPDPDNPQHFIRFKDRNGENAKVILDGHGIPVGANETGTVQYAYVDPDSVPGAINPVIIESPDHGLNDGTIISITGALDRGGDASEINGDWEIALIDADTFRINGILTVNYRDNSGTWTSRPGSTLVEKYNEFDLLILGIPSQI